MRRAWLLGAVLVGASAAALRAQGAAAEWGTIAVFVPPDQKIEFGRPFVLEVHRTLHIGHAAEPFDEQSLGPATVQFEAEERPSVVLPLHSEIRRYSARVFASGEVVIPAPVMRVREANGTVHVVEGQPTKLNVRSILPDPPGDIEWAGDVRDRPTAMAWWWIAVALLLVGGGVAASWRRHVPTAQPIVAAHEPPLHESVLAELAALQIAVDADQEAVTAYYTALAGIVRSYTGRRFSVPALVRTSEELLRSVPTGAELLAPCLQACDLVKFAAARPRFAEHEAARATAVRFVRSTAPPAGAS